MPSPKLSIVFDTSFLIAAALKDGYCHDFLFNEPEQRTLHRILYTSPAIMQELQDKLENSLYSDRFDVLVYIEDLAKIMHQVIPRQKLRVARDPDDNKILECALEAKAEIVLSFDKDLLSLKEYEGIKIVHPRMLQYLFPTDKTGNS